MSSRRPDQSWIRLPRLAVVRGGALALALSGLSGCGFGPEAPAADCVAGIACSTGLVGACGTGVTRCLDTSGVTECAPIATATTEACDGSDNDCDGSIDEGLSDQVEGSNVGMCRPQVVRCVQGVITETQVRIDPQPEVCDDGLDQDCDGSDCSAGPDVRIVSPVPGTALVEGSEITVLVEASDADGIDKVELWVDGKREETDRSVPYEFSLRVPFGARGLDLEARAEDETGDEASSGVVRFDVIEAPKTRVIGRIVDLAGDPIGGALARARLSDAQGAGLVLEDTTDGNGAFSIPNVPTVLGDIVVEALLPGSPTVRGSSAPTTPIAGGVTDVGTIRLIDVEFEQDLGSRLDLDDDDFERIDFDGPFRFPFYGVTYDRVWVSSNGRLTFEFGDKADRESVTWFNFQAGIAPLFDDLDPDDGNGGVYVNAHADRLVVTWWRVEDKDGANTFQVVLRDNGGIQLAYDGIKSKDGLVGITPGDSSVPKESDLDRDTPFTAAPGAMIYELFKGKRKFDLDEQVLLFTPNASWAYRVELVPLLD